MSQRRPRRLALTAAAMVVALASAGCTYLNPTQTHDFYQAGDGMNARLGDVGVRNAIVVAEDSGSGQLYATVVNESEKDASVSLEGSSESGDVAFSKTIQVPAGSSVMVGPPTVTQPGAAQEDTQEVALTTVPAKAGGIMKLKVSDGSATETISLPVTNSSPEYYRVETSDGGKS